MHVEEKQIGELKHPINQWQLIISTVCLIVGAALVAGWFIYQDNNPSAAQRARDFTVTAEGRLVQDIALTIFDDHPLLLDAGPKVLQDGIAENIRWIFQSPREEEEFVSVHAIARSNFSLESKSIPDTIYYIKVEMPFDLLVYETRVRVEPRDQEVKLEHNLP